MNVLLGGELHCRVKVFPITKKPALEFALPDQILLLSA